MTELVAKLRGRARLALGCGWRARLVVVCGWRARLAVPLLLLVGAAWGEALPTFETDVAADRWLREHTALYRTMAEAVDRRGGYTIRPGGEGVKGGMAWMANGRGYIELNARLRGAERVSMIVFELTNLYQDARHQEVVSRVRRGELTDAGLFAMLRESIEYDGLRLHRDVLFELGPVLGVVPPEMIVWAARATGSAARTLADYQLPSAYDYLKIQLAAGHSAHYLKLFERHRAEYAEAVKRATAAEGAGDAAAYAAVVATEPGLLGYWPLQGSLAAATGELKLQAVGEASFTPGPLGRPCADLRHGHPLMLAPTADLDRGELTVELLFKFPQAQAGAPCLVGVRGAKGTRFSLHCRLDSSKLVVWNGTAVYSYQPDDLLMPGQWYHVALHAGAQGLALWLNGKPCPPDGGPAPAGAASGLPLLVGAATPDGFDRAELLVAQLAVGTAAPTPERLARRLQAAGWAGKLAKAHNWRTSPVSILASQIGYHPRNVKRVYLRSASAEPPAGVFEPEFAVVNATTEETVHRGRVERWGEQWGTWWWVLDFTPVRATGDFYVKTGTLTSSVFRIAEGVFGATDLDVIALDQLEHRLHQGLDDPRPGLKGKYTKPGVRIYMDCGSPYAELEPVGTCVYALLDLHDKLGERFSAKDRARMVELARLGADYIAACQRESDDPLKDGMFAHSLLVNTKDTWAGDIFTWLDTAYAMALLARASAFFQMRDPARAAHYLAVAQRAWRLCVRRPYHIDDDFAFPKGCNAWFWNAPAGIQDSFGRCVYNVADPAWKRPKTLRTRDRLPFIQGSALLYELTREAPYLAEAVKFADAVAERQFTDWQHPIDGCWGNFYEFEGDDQSFFIEFAQGGHWWEGNVEACNLEGFLHLLRLAPDHPRAGTWANVVRTYAQDYARAATTRNPLGISPVACYRDAAHGGLKWFQNTLMGASCLHGFSTKNFLALGAALGDSRCQLNALAGVNFIAGLNPGVPNAFHETAWEARSLIQGVGRAWFGPVGDLAPTARGSVPNGFTAAPQFWQPTWQNRIADQPDRPAGLINAAGGLQFNEGWILHSHAYVQGVAHLEAPFNLRLTTLDDGRPVAAEVLVVLRETAPPHTELRRAERTGPTGQLVLGDLPTPADGEVTVTWHGQTLTRPLAAIAGADHSLVLDFARELDLRLAVPAQLPAGAAGEATLTARNAGHGAVTAVLRLSAGGVALGRDRVELTLAPGEQASVPLGLVAGPRVTPYLVRACLASGAPARVVEAVGRVARPGP